MPIPVHVIYGLMGVLGFISIIALLFSINAVHGITIKSCKGDGSCGCEGHEKGKTAERILSLINK